MKKFLLLITNIAIICFVLLFVTIYAQKELTADVQNQKENFKNITISAELVTKNYLEGEQRTCDSWANFINSCRELTIEEAITFVRNSKTSPEIIGHILFERDGKLIGLSTRTYSPENAEYSISYENLDIFESFDEIEASGEGVNVTRAYINPATGVQSIAFYDKIKLWNAEDQSYYDAYLLRLVPMSLVKSKWSFPTDKYKNAEISIVDAKGNFILKGDSFTKSNIYECYDEHNKPGNPDYIDIRQTFMEKSGGFEMVNVKGQTEYIAFNRINTNRQWCFISSIPIEDLHQKTIDWMLLGIVAISILLLLVFDIISMLSLNHKLEIAAKAAETANQAKTDFLSTMSHDIRTPMNAIIGLTTIAEKNIGHPELVTENLKKITMASNHLLTLINDILDISKVESGKINLTPVTFSIVESAENLVNISQPLVREKVIDFRFRIKNIQNEFLYADKLRLNQIFINLLSNALKYTPKGGQVCVDLHEENSGKDGIIKLCYTVTDTGIGMSQEFIEKMYEPFIRQTDSRINTIQVTGLGLAITKKMIDLMNGSISCESKLGEGTCFKVTIEVPIADMQEAEMVLPPIDVLIIDDDEILLETAQDTLKSLGATAQVSKSGYEALDIIEAHIQEKKPFDVIILDWQMPEISGVELTRKIREKAGDKIPILLVSAYDWSVIEENAKNAGINGFISKPLFRSSLYKKISEVLHLEINCDAKEENNDDIAGMNIIIAEDIDVNYEIVSTFLEMYGINSVRAENGEAAVALMESAVEKQYDMIFMDIQMPVMNGLDATRAIRRLANPAARNIPIVAMTADAFSENVAECMEAGMNGHIAKPIDVKVVIKEIRRIKEEYGA